MPRRETFLLSLEQLEDRCVLSGDGSMTMAIPTLTVPTITSTNPQAYLDKIQQQVQSIIQQARSQGEQEIARANSIVQSSGQSSDTVTTTPATIGTGSTGGSQTTHGGSTSTPVPSPGTTTTPATPVQSGTSSVSSGASQPNAAIVNSSTAAAVAANARTTESVAGADSGLTAVPPAATSNSTTANSTTQTVNPAITVQTSAATLTAESAGSTTVQVGLGTPAPAAWPTGVITAIGLPGLVGSGIRTYPYGETQPISRDAFGIDAVTSPAEAALAVAGPALLGADLLNGAAPQDAATVDLGVRQFLGQIDDLGRSLTRSLQETNPALWVAGAVLGLVAFEVVRRRRARRALNLATGSHGLADSWVPGLPGLLSSEES
jgi:hypothetical protein